MSTDKNESRLAHIRFPALAFLKFGLVHWIIYVCCDWPELISVLVNTQLKNTLIIPISFPEFALPLASLPVPLDNGDRASGKKEMRSVSPVFLLLQVFFIFFSLRYFGSSYWSEEIDDL